MLDALMNSATGEIKKQVQDKFGMDSTKAEKSLSITKETMQAGLMKELTGGNIGGVLGLLNGNESATTSPLASSLIKQVIGSLTSQLGLNQSIASSIATFAVPFILNKISDKKPSGGFDQNTVHNLLGDRFKENIAGGIKSNLGKGIGKMFGK